MTGVVIVGSGVAGATAAQTLRAEGCTGPVTVVGAEAGHPYRRTALSKDLLAADLSVERIRLQKPEFWADRDITFVSGVAVTDVDPDARTVTLSDGRALGYRALILATGGRPIRPAWLHDDVPSLRTVADAERIRATITDRGGLVVIGGGLIGLELAASTAAAGLPVTVLEAGEKVLSRVVPPAVADYLADLHRDRGVQVRCGARVVTADPSGADLDDGTRVTGAVVAALGMVPNVAAAQSAGALVERSGIVVDSCLRTSVDGIYAAGDVATGGAADGEHWFGAMDQGAAVARSVVADLDGRPAPVYAEVPRAWTMQYGVNIQMVGAPTADGEVAIDGDLADGSATITVTGPDGLLGAVTVGRAAAARELRARIAAGLGSTV